MREVIKILTPPDKWKIPVIIVLAVFSGLMLYIAYISNFTSYLTDDPKACVNCHIMAPQYATWSHSAHRERANCNDCHVPHNNVFNKYFFKAKDGLRHATIFTLRGEPQVIFINEPGKEVVQGNCIRCHSNLFENDEPLAEAKEYNHNEDRLCWECHRETPHGRVNSLSSVPYARVPLPETPVPEWLKKLMEN